MNTTQSTQPIGFSTGTAYEIKKQVRKVFPHVKFEIRQVSQHSEQKNGSERNVSVLLHLRANEKPDDVTRTLAKQCGLNATPFNNHGSTLEIKHYDSVR